MKPNLSRHFLAIAPAFFALATLPAQAQQLSRQLQNAVGHWQILDKKGAPQGKAETYLENGKLFGKITELRPGRLPSDICRKCSGENKNKPILNLIFIRDFHPEGDQWVGGTVLDPENGKEYQGKIWAVGSDKLSMHGFVGISVLGRTETWVRLP